jgi:hypothetical protein
MRVALVVNNRAHQIFETIESMESLRKRISPEFLLADLSTFNPAPQEGWLYVSRTGQFIDPALVETSDMKWARLRAERNRRINNPTLTDRLERYRNQRDGNIPTTDSTVWYHAALEYLQSLRDLPVNTRDPANPVWPASPE